MLSWVLLIVLLVALVAVGTWFWGRVFGRGEVLPPIQSSSQVIELNRKAVGTGDLSGLEFEIVRRGYRPEQVDDVIAHLEWQLAEAHRELRQRSSAEKD